MRGSRKLSLELLRLRHSLSIRSYARHILCVQARVRIVTLLFALLLSVLAPPSDSDSGLPPLGVGMSGSTVCIAAVSVNYGALWVHV